MKIIRIHDAIYEIKGENYEMMEELNITNQMIRDRLLKNWTLAEACQVPKGMKREDLVYINYAKQYEEDNEEAKQNYHDEKQREERPWLYDGTPQNHNRGKWCQYLMNTSIFPKAVR
ncbi:SA1788 family PVL leukocidin-associated protein [Staphylococcus nepalensis]|uniref:SA1788 family PVL leukocidin-associated protein n=1 Tax=Staphylococcus nepalensis TaxID=214473 RepID=UPI0022707D2B|nr:SA1788 family PVL leukocidin-associated protein [Staphylococcus nepalensis]MCY1039611.1 SA1788 family PVL leukocidin-associated protein [Staphylococcus nepalensis]